MFIEASEVGYNSIPNNLPVASTVSVAGRSRRQMNVLTHEEQEAIRPKFNVKKHKNYKMTQLRKKATKVHCSNFDYIQIKEIGKTPMFIEAREVGSIPIPDNLPTYSSLSVTGGTNKEQCIDQNASVLLGTSCGINDTLNKGNAQFVLIMDTTLSDTGEPIIANDVFESLKYAANINAPVSIAATSTGTSDICILSITNNAFTNKCCMLPDVPMEDCISQTTIMNNISHNNLQLNTTTTKSSVTSSDQPLTNEPTMNNKPNPRNIRAIGHNSARNYVDSKRIKTYKLLPPRQCKHRKARLFVRETRGFCCLSGKVNLGISAVPTELLELYDDKSTVVLMYLLKLQPHMQPIMIAACRSKLWLITSVSQKIVDANMKIRHRPKLNNVKAMEATVVVKYFTTPR
ncbi:hypothetical protein GIB67_008782 [Kingdonia uniflora]|uniref:Uncharacterized protein n=1 Tax=Kingdonia uniflora TaxID=39325 RepID=A0A7J7P5J1_9MAGN|nr:hypothetical protein GIB67_008782 [Kingdonia uniflora]